MMTEFDKWWNEEMDYEASKYEILRHSKKDLKEQKKRAAIDGWNGAVERVKDLIYSRTHNGIRLSELDDMKYD